MNIYNNFIMILNQLVKLIYSPFNRLLILACSSQIISMFVKLIITTIKTKKFSFKNMARYGGMPSSHTVFMGSMIFGIAFDPDFGWNHPLFTVALVITAIVLTDTVKLRGTIDKLNKTLAEIIDENKDLKSKIQIPKLIAHTPLEVIVGIIVAFLYTILFYLLFFSAFPNLIK